MTITWTIEQRNVRKGLGWRAVCCVRSEYPIRVAKDPGNGALHHPHRWFLVDDPKTVLRTARTWNFAPLVMPRPAWILGESEAQNVFDHMQREVERFEELRSSWRDVDQKIAAITLVTCAMQRGVTLQTELQCKEHVLEHMERARVQAAERARKKYARGVGEILMGGHRR